MGLFRQATQHIWQSPDSGGEVSYSKGDTRPSGVFRNRHPVGPQGRHRCHVGNLPEARPAFPKPCGRRGCGLRARRKCAECGCFPRVRPEVRGRARKVCVSPGESTLCAEDGYSPDKHVWLYIELYLYNNPA